MKKYADHAYADCPEPNRHHKTAHRLIPQAPEVSHTPTPLNEIEGVMKPFTVKYGYSKQDLLFPNGEHVFFKTLRDASRTFRAVNAHEELLGVLKDIAGYTSMPNTPEGRGLTERLLKAIAKAEGGK